MFDLFGLKRDEEMFERSRLELQKSMDDMIRFHETLGLFLLDLKDLDDEGVNALFIKYAVEVK